MIDHHHANACQLGEGLAVHWDGRPDAIVPLVDGSPWPAIEELRAVGGTAAIAALSLILDRGPLGRFTITHDGLHVRHTYTGPDGTPVPVVAIISPYPFTLAQLIRAGLN